jgi:hypothetical protein
VNFLTTYSVFLGDGACWSHNASFWSANSMRVSHPSPVYVIQIKT